MKVRVSIPYLVLLALLFLPTVSFGEEYPDELIDAKRRHMQYREKTVRDFEVNKGKLAIQYGSALKAKEKAAQQAGNLNALLAVRGELTRFDEDKTWLENVPADTSADIRPLMVIGAKQLRDLKVRRDKELDSFDVSYKRTLLKVMKGLTIDDRILDAKKVRKELDDVSAGEPGLLLEEIVPVEPELATGGDPEAEPPPPREIPFSFSRWVKKLDESERGKPVYGELAESVRDLQTAFRSTELEDQQDGLTQAMMTIDRAVETKNGDMLAWKLCEKYLVPNLSLASADPDSFANRAGLKAYIAAAKERAGVE
jgi:hypothetical protein